jgi:hypothetical protein
VKRASLLLLALAGCFGSPRPVIESFTVDELNPDARAPVQFSYLVFGAQTVRIDPYPGEVHGSPVTVYPIVSTTFTLRAFNDDGVEASAHLSLNVRAPFQIETADVSPGQAAPGAAVTLSWTTSGSERATLTDGETGQLSNVSPNGSAVVHPTKTAIYTLTAYNKPGRKPDFVTARLTARVAIPPTVSDFVATPPAIVQGDSTTLTWKGNAVSYSVTGLRADGALTTFNLGPMRSLLVRPIANTTYTLNAVSSGGTLLQPPTVTVPVEPHPATTLAYGAPGPGALQLVADSCPIPCAAVTLRIKAPSSASSVKLRGLAFNLPLDTTKVSLVAGSFSKGAPMASAVSAATMGSGVLQDVLVIGMALEGNGSAAAQDVTLNPGDELAHFILALNPVGGRGTVFDGAAPGSAYKAMVQSSSGRTASAIAVGRLDAQ